MKSTFRQYMIYLGMGVQHRGFAGAAVCVGVTALAASCAYLGFGLKPGIVTLNLFVIVLSYLWVMESIDQGKVIYASPSFEPSVRTITHSKMNDFRRGLQERGYFFPIFAASIIGVFSGVFALVAGSLPALCLFATLALPVACIFALDTVGLGGELRASETIEARSRAREQAEGTHQTKAGCTCDAS